MVKKQKLASENIKTQSKIVPKDIPPIKTHKIENNTKFDEKKTKNIQKEKHNLHKDPKN